MIKNEKLTQRLLSSPMIWHDAKEEMPGLNDDNYYLFLVMQEYVPKNPCEETGINKCHTILTGYYMVVTTGSDLYGNDGDRFEGLLTYDNRVDWDYVVNNKNTNFVCACSDIDWTDLKKEVYLRYSKKPFDGSFTLSEIAYWAKVWEFGYSMQCSRT